MSSAMEHLSLGVTGEIAVGATEVQGPNIKCKLVKITANPGNSGNIWVGLASGVTVGDNATDTTSGFGLDAGKDTGWLPANNLNELWLIGDAGQGATYMTLT